MKFRDLAAKLTPALTVIALVLVTVASLRAAEPPAAIVSFAASAPFAQRPDLPTLTWEVSGTVDSLSISPDIGDVTAHTSGGQGMLSVSPIGHRKYTLTLNGTITQDVSVIGLPVREKVHIFLLAGQSNMQGQGQGYNQSLDAPDPRVLKFGSRDGMEPVFAEGGHRLTSLGTSSGVVIGMGVEFGKTLIAAETDPEVVVCLINHALGSTAIQWWEPGAVNGSNGTTLYDDALRRMADASQYGTPKGILWHQGEYNANNNTNPSSDPSGYAMRLSQLVDRFRMDLGIPWLPFVCGKFVPRDWQNGGTADDYTGLPNRAIVEAALQQLPAARSNTFCVDNGGLRGNDSDKIHFDAPSQRILGQRYANAVIGMYSDPLRLYMGGYYPPAELADATLSDPKGDNDHDGVPNGVEAFFGTDPSVFSPGLIAGIVEAGSGTFAFTHPANRRSPLPFEAAYRWSSDLASFHASGETSEGTTVTFSVQNETPAAGQTTVTAEITGTPLDRLFIDVKVTQP